jgi:hypothetical protein
MSTCPSCGGILGRDCWNPQECAQITAQMRQEERSSNPDRDDLLMALREIAAYQRRKPGGAKGSYMRGYDIGFNNAGLVAAGIAEAAIAKVLGDRSASAGSDAAQVAGDRSRDDPSPPLPTQGQET